MRLTTPLKCDAADRFLLRAGLPSPISNRFLHRLRNSSWRDLSRAAIGFLSVVAPAAVAALAACLIPLSARAQTIAPAEPPQASSAGPVAPQRHLLTPQDLQTWLDGLVPYALKQSDIAGAVIAVVKDGSVLLETGYGYADISKQLPMNPKLTVLHVASVSKLFTWTAVMQLVQQHKIDLDRNVNDYLDFKVPEPFGKITMRNLMTHTAGFADIMEQYNTNGSPPRSLGPYMRLVPPPPCIFPPGEIPAYSNYGANLAGYIVERVSGEPFDEYVERHIFEPLSMIHSTFHRPLAPALQRDLAKNYSAATALTPYPIYVNDQEPTDWPAGGLATTADDMAHFMIAHLDGGSYNGAELFSPETAKLMHTTTFVAMPGAQGTALGIFHWDRNGHDILMHDGDLTGFHSDLELLPRQGVGFFLAVNSDGTGTLLGAAVTFRDSLFQHFLNRYFPAPPARYFPTVATAERDATRVAGTYQMTRRSHGNFMELIDLAVQVAIHANPDGTISTTGFLNLETQRPQTWREVAPYTWQDTDGTARLNMKVVAGRVVEWLPDDIPSGFVFQPVTFWHSRAFILPLLAFLCITLALDMILWPAAALVRRKLGGMLELPLREASAVRLRRYAALTGVAFLLGWIILLIAMSAGVLLQNVGLNPWLRLIQLVGLLVIPGAGLACWSAWVTCTSSRAWWIKAWSVLPAIALTALVWFSFAFHLLSININF